MKIVHIAVSFPYIDGWGYQENILPLYQQKQGDEVTVIASDVLPRQYKLKKFTTGCYIDNGLRIIRIHGYRITNTLIITSPFLSLLEKEKPDIIFHHNVNCTSLITVINYKKKHHECVILCDNHCDYINHSKNKLWQLFYYRLCIGGSLLFCKKYITKFYGVTLLRCDYLHEMYGIPWNKIDFLPTGADVDEAETIISQSTLQIKYGYTKENFIIVSGGKMSKSKGTITLIKTVAELNKVDNNYKLLLFGRFDDKETQALAQSYNFIHVEGWCNRQKTLELLKLASVAIWPIHHTSLIEDCIAVGTPLIIRRTRTTEHLIKNNGVFVKNGDMQELYNAIIKIKRLPLEFKEECKTMRDRFSYYVIASKIRKDAQK